MGFESPDSLQISTRLGKPSSEHIPEATPAPDTPPAAAAALPEQDELKISTRLQPRVADKPPVESAQIIAVPEAAPTESTEPYIDPYGEWEDFRGHRLMGNGETEHEEFQIGQELTAKHHLEVIQQ
jgi:hypothetical protein